MPVSNKSQSDFGNKISARKLLNIKPGFQSFCVGFLTRRRSLELLELEIKGNMNLLINNFLYDKVQDSFFFLIVIYSPLNINRTKHEYLRRHFKY